MSLISKLKGYFNISADLDDLDVARQQIIEGVSFRGSNIIILIIAIFIASLGLNTNSAPVVIGAMLISPLMGPIIGVGLGVGTYDFPLIKRSARNLIMAAIFSVLTATVYFLISPVSEGHSELLARTSPTIYDVFIGFFGGAAGIVAIACKNKGNVIPGVAIATALMPPLCTVGYGLATWQLNYFLGALYLFIINSIFIAFATLVGVKLFHFKKMEFVNPQNQRRVKRIVYIIVILTLIPSIYLTLMMLRDSFFTRDANNFIDDQFQFSNTQVFSKKVYTKGWGKYIEVTLIGDRLNTDSLQMALLAKMHGTRMLRDTHLTIKQGITFTANTPQEASNTNEVFSAMVSRINRQSADIDSLRAMVTRREALDSLSYTIAPELQVIYPQISYIALNRTMLTNVADRHIDTLNIAIIETTRPIPDMPRLQRYLETRTGLSPLQIVQPRLRNL